MLRAGLIIMAGLLTAAAADYPRDLSGPAIIAAFEGHTAKGAYADGTAFRESYEAGGRISYWDPRGGTTGKWSVRNDLLCTFYDNGMSGGCFRIAQVAENCFDFYAVTITEEEAMSPGPRRDYTARGSLTHAKSTCPDELQA
jgi:hypothetical protein